MDMMNFISTWTGITTYYIIGFGLFLGLILAFFVLISVVDSYLGRNRPKKRLEQGFGGFVVTFSSTLTLYIFMMYYAVGILCLSPILAFIRSLLTENTFPVFYYQLLALFICYIIAHHFISERQRHYINRNNFYIMSNNTLIVKMNYFYSYIPLTNVKEIQLDKENNIVKFIFKMRLAYILKITPRWLFEFADKETFNSLITMTLKNYEHLIVEKHLKRKKFARMLPRVPMGNEFSLDQKYAELPAPIRKIFTS